MKGLRWWTAVAVVLLGGAVNYGLPHTEVPPPRPKLQLLAAEMGGYMAQDIAIEPRLVEASSVDTYLNRVYHDATGGEVGLYIGYYRSQRAGDSVHSPKNCLPGAGWQPVAYSRLALELHPGRRDTVNYYLVANEHQKIVVLYWYQAHGRVVASEYEAKLRTIQDALWLHRTDAALVRITVPVEGGDAALARERASAFAAMLGPKLDVVMPR